MVLLTDIADFAAMNAVYATFFYERYARTHLLSGIKVPMGAKVEIDAVAVSKTHPAENGRKDLTSPPIKTIIYRTTRDSALFSGLSATVCDRRGMRDPIRPLLSDRRETGTPERCWDFPAGSIKAQAQ